MTPVITSWTQGAWIALDILLVALLIYQVLVMIRGTRAVPMLVGLVVVAVTFYLARIGELTTLNWVVSHVLPYLVFALIVVFQSEIRHVLADLGRRLTFFSGSSADSDSYDDIVLAAVIAHDLGAPLLKVPIPDVAEGTERVDAVDRVVSSVGVPVLFLGGPHRGDGHQRVLDEVRDVMDGGGSGLAMGRAIFQEPSPGVMAEQVAGIVHRA